MCQNFVHSTSRENSVSEFLEWSKMNYCVFVINAWKGRAGYTFSGQSSFDRFYGSGNERFWERNISPDQF